jgi:hypothetical protein
MAEGELPELTSDRTIGSVGLYDELGRWKHRAVLRGSADRKTSPCAVRWVVCEGMVVCYPLYITRVSIHGSSPHCKLPKPM